MRRRDLIIACGAVAFLPRAARSQEARKTKLAAILNNGSSETVARENAVFRESLAKLGWVEGQNITIVTRTVENDAERLRSTISEIVQSRPDVILTTGSTATATLARQTRTIPIVFNGVSDPVAQGLVASAAHPGGNVTGFSNFEFAVGAKWLELLKQIAPQISTVALILNAANPNTDLFLRSAQAGEGPLGLTVSPIYITGAGQLDGAVAELARQSRIGLCFPADNLVINQRDRIIALAAQFRLPAIYPFRFFPDHGGLISYGNDVVVP